MQVKGTLKRKFDKRLNSGKSIYSFVIEERDEYFRTGFAEVAANVGDTVEFSAKETQYGLEVDTKTFKATPAGEGAASPASRRSAGGTPAGSSSARDAYWDQKEKYNNNVVQPMIQYQAATNVAKDICIAALAAGKLPESGKNKNDKFENLLQCIFQVRDQIFSDYRARSAAFEKGDYSVGTAEVDFEDIADDPDDWPEQG